MPTNKFIGRRYSIGLGVESTRGVAVAPEYYIPKTDLSVTPEIKTATDQSSVNVIEDSINVAIVSRAVKIGITGLCYDRSIGVFFKNLFGTEAVATVSSGAYTHTFTMLQTNQHPSLSMTAISPNENSGNGLIYDLGMIDSFDFSGEVGKFCTYKAALTANTNANTTQTVSVIAENPFRPQDAACTFATTLSGLSSGTTVQIKKYSITFKASPMQDIVLSSLDPVDNLNQELSIEGSLELTYQDRSWIDTYLVPNTPVALQILLQNAGVTIGSASNPTIQLQLAKCYLTSVTPKIDNKGIIMQTIKFKSVYSIGDTQSCNLVLTNARSTAY